MYQTSMKVYVNDGRRDYVLVEGPYRTVGDSVQGTGRGLVTPGHQSNIVLV